MDSSLYTRLSTDTNISAITTRIYPVWASAETQIPCVIYKREDLAFNQPLNTTTGVGLYQYYIQSVALNNSTVESLDAAIRTSLTTWSGYQVIVGQSQHIDTDVGYILQTTYTINGS